MNCPHFYYNYLGRNYKPTRPENTKNMLRRCLYYTVSTNNADSLEHVIKSGTEPELFSLLQALKKQSGIITNKIGALIGKSFVTDFALGRLLRLLIENDSSREECLRNHLKNRWSETNDGRLLESLLKVAMLSAVDFLMKEDINKIVGKRTKADLILAFSDYCSLFKKSIFLSHISSIFNEISRNDPALGFFIEDNLYELNKNKVTKKRDNSSLFFQWKELSGFLKNIVADSETTVLQFMFYGDPSMSGKKNTGGLTTFLIALGNELAKKANVITIGILPVVKTHEGSIYKAISEHHALLRIPLYITSSYNLFKPNRIYRKVLTY